MKNTNARKFFNTMNGFTPAMLAAVMMLSSGSSLAAAAAKNDTVSGIGTQTSVSFMSSLPFSSRKLSPAEEEVKKKALKLAMDVACAAMGEFIPGGRTMAALFGGVFNIAAAESGPTIADVQKDISELRDHIDEKVDEIKNNMDNNTQTICQTVENAISLGSKGTSLSSMINTTEQFNLQIEKYKSDDSISQEDKLAFIASRIRKSGDWGDNGTNLIYEVAAASKALSGTDLMITNSDLQARDAFMSAYKLACKNAMFSGDAYDAAAPYANHVMMEYINSYTTAMECLLAAKELSHFTPEQIASLSEEGRENYDLACKNESLIDTEILYLTELAWNADSKDSVISHYAAFMYGKECDRNVFVNMNANGDGFAVSPTLAVDDMKCNVSKYADYYLYKEFEARFNAIKDETTKSVKNAANSSAVSAEQIDKMRKLAYSKGMSFNQYLNSMGISTDYGNNCCFPVPNIVTTSGDKVAHSGGAPDQEMYIQMQTFDADKKNAPATTKTVYTIRSYNQWRNRIETIYWSCVGYNKDEPGCRMLKFQKGERTVIPQTATEIMTERQKTISYCAHVQESGWLDTVTSTEKIPRTAGITGQALRMEAVKIFLNNTDGSSAVQYRAHVQRDGWQGWCSSGEVAGTEGESRRLEALEIKLAGEYAEKYDVVYRVYCEGAGWTGWVKNGQTAGTTGQSKRVEAVEIKLVPKS